jgi:acetyl esterase/lipase
VIRFDYGSDPSQFGELYRPPTPRNPGTVVIIHGGFWRSRYDLSLGRPLAHDLVAAGHTVWNIEYRRVGNGGGWPATLDDVAAAIDHLAELDADTSRVVTVGHSAGGQLAVWAAGRPDPRVRVTAAVAQAGVLDLATACRQHVGETAVSDLLGGTPDDVPDRYAAADPIVHAPLPVPVVCVHAPADTDVPIAQSRAYVAASGGAASLVEVAGDHYSVIDPASADWAVVREVLAR